MARTRKKDGSALTGELAETASAINKRYGEFVMRKADKVVQPDRISTGVFVLDMATLGGIPHNRASLLTGKRSAGKSTMCGKIIRGVQKMDLDSVPVYIDAEGTFDAEWATQLGVDTDRLMVVEPESGEMAVDIADAVVSSRETSLVLIDSLAALTPTREIDSSAEDAHVGIHAKLISSMVRKLTAAMIKERSRGHFVTIMYVNQWRAQIGGFSPFGEPRSLPGGKALDYSTSVHIDIKNKENKGRNAESVETITTNEHSYSILKNKICNSSRSGEFTLIRDDDVQPPLTSGDIDNAPTMLTFAKKFGYYTGAGKSQHLEFDDVHLQFGKQEECIQALREDQALQAHLWFWLVGHQAAASHMPEQFVNKIIKMRNFFSE
jgi:recombination protein RecA